MGMCYSVGSVMRQGGSSLTRFTGRCTKSDRITEAACMAHARRKIHDVHARALTDITTEALQCIGELYAIEAEIRGRSAEQRLAARKARAVPLMLSLYNWIQTYCHVTRRRLGLGRSHTC